MTVTCMNMLGDERLDTLSEIANDCLGIAPLASPVQRQDARFVVVRAEDIARALESAYDVGLINGYRLHRLNGM
ncbi:hypothetical protein [Paraburkholderia xenovorans]|uniref:hypothetical protein n=1 Tax=Paraburkholderia xenovorans TaxID=36873 RepID=UPI0038BC69F9